MSGRMPEGTPRGWFWSDARDPRRVPATPQATLTETDNPVTATLLGPDGRPLRQLTQRPRLPFGYQPSPSVAAPDAEADPAPSSASGTGAVGHA